jgi:hypothetical protein
MKQQHMGSIIGIARQQETKTKGQIINKKLIQTMEYHPEISIANVNVDIGGYLVADRGLVCIRRCRGYNKVRLYQIEVYAHEWIFDNEMGPIRIFPLKSIKGMKKKIIVDTTDSCFKKAEVTFQVLGSSDIVMTMDWASASDLWQSFSKLV